MIEVWKDIDGYEGLYQVSTVGNVKSLNYNRTGKEGILRPGVRKKYLFVTLCKKGKHKNYNIQQLVANAFISNPKGYTVVNHKDRNPLNNRVDNLEWCTQQYNVEYSLAIPIYCVELDKVFPSSTEAERQTGIYQGSINKCCKGKRKSAGGYHWRYA